MKEGTTLIRKEKRMLEKARLKRFKGINTMKENSLRGARQLNLVFFLIYYS